MKFIEMELLLQTGTQYRRMQNIQTCSNPVLTLPQLHPLIILLPTPLLLFPPPHSSTIVSSFYVSIS
ncbi:hypothetical protein EMCRGX_G030660 [Ephydatia muelleri]